MAAGFGCEHKGCLIQTAFIMLLSIAGCNAFTGLDSGPSVFAEQAQILFRG